MKVFKKEKDIKLDATAKDDILPYKVYKRPALTGPNAGKVLDLNDFNKLLSMYYEKRGWDRNGIPSFDTEKKFS